MEATVRQRRLLFAGAVARQTDGRLPNRLMFAKGLVGGMNPGRGGLELNWTTCLKDDLKVFGAKHGSTDDEPCVFGLPKRTWEEAARVKGGTSWHAGVVKGLGRYMTSWHKGEEEASRKRAIERDNKATKKIGAAKTSGCLLYTSPSPRD